jgi:hypothetical protein
MCYHWLVRPKLNVAAVLLLQQLAWFGIARSTWAVSASSPLKRACSRCWCSLCRGTFSACPRTADFELKWSRFSILAIVVLLYLRLYIFFKRKPQIRVPIAASDHSPSTPGVTDKRHSNPVTWAYHQLRKLSKDSSTAVWSDLTNVELDVCPEMVERRRASDNSVLAPSERSLAKEGIDWTTTVQWQDHASTLPDLPASSPRTSRLLSVSVNAPNASRRASASMPPSPLRSVSTPSIADQQTTCLEALRDRSPYGNPSTAPEPTLDPDEMNRRAAMLMLLYPAAVSPFAQPTQSADTSGSTSACSR